MAIAWLLPHDIVWLFPSQMVTVCHRDGRHTYDISTYLNVPTQGSPKTELLAVTVHEFFPLQLLRTSLNEPSAAQSVVSMSELGHLRNTIFCLVTKLLSEKSKNNISLRVSFL